MVIAKYSEVQRREEKVMPNCQNCDYKWSWFDTFKIGVTNNKKCPNCGEGQYVMLQKSKAIYFVFFASLIVLLFSRPFFDLSDTVYISFGILFALIMFVIMPYTIKLSNEQKPLW